MSVHIDMSRLLFEYHAKAMFLQRKAMHLGHLAGKEQATLLLKVTHPLRRRGSRSRFLLLRIRFQGMSGVILLLAIIAIVMLLVRGIGFGFGHSGFCDGANCNWLIASLFDLAARADATA